MVETKKCQNKGLTRAGTGISRFGTEISGLGTRLWVLGTGLTRRTKRYLFVWVATHHTRSLFGLNFGGIFKTEWSWMAHGSGLSITRNGRFSFLELASSQFFSSIDCYFTFFFFVWLKVWASDGDLGWGAWSI